MDPLITIGIASYNYAHYIVQELDAIKRQKFKDYEILISDDCSTDDSAAVIKKYMQDNPQLTIRLMESEKNEGLIANKNKLIRHCRGKYLMLCDADDWMSGDCLEKISEVIYAEEPDRILVEVAHMDDSGKVLKIDDLCEGQSKWGWLIHHGCVNKVSILREHHIQMIRGVPDDVYFTIEFSKYCRKIRIIKEVLYYWRVHFKSEARKICHHVTETMIRENCIKTLVYIGDTVQYIDDHREIYSKSDREELRLVMLKIYYWQILFYFQRSSLMDTWKGYSILHDAIRMIDKDYSQNRYLSRKTMAPLRPFAMHVIRLCTKIEKMHLMGVALVVYHMIAKFRYFDE